MYLNAQWHALLLLLAHVEVGRYLTKFSVCCPLTDHDHRSGLEGQDVKTKPGLETGLLSIQKRLP